MKISFIEMEGFRGVRAHVRINMPDGFVVITGRNGSGKSTICDAVEFALTGTLSKYEDNIERGESTEDYVWWRGQWPAANNVVRVGLRDADGRELVVSRTPSGVDLDGGADIAAMLCDVRVVSRDPLGQLCRTAIIRDEYIAALSIDMEEAKRFSFVRTALGTDALEGVVARGKEILGAMRKRSEAATLSYVRSREEVTALVSQVAEARANATESPGVVEAETIVRELVAPAATEPARVLADARQRLASWRRLSETLLRIARDVQAVREEMAELESPDRAKELHELEARRTLLNAESDRTRVDVARMRADLGADQSRASRRTLLASLHEVGRSIGLRHEGCPLCGAKQSQLQFDTALTALAREIASADQRAAELRANLAQGSAQLDALQAEASAIERQLRGIVARRAELAQALARLAQEAGGRTPADALTVEALLQRVQVGQERIERLEGALNVLEASAALERIAELERRLSSTREQSDSLEARLREAEAAEARAKRLLTGIRRAVGEVAEERLAALEPLLKDLYARLKPHSEWTDLNYRVRGDVKKFLSLRVGDDVNPRFTFSSGQRRAIGLAFLLAIHLSRPWCRLRTLILDDPIQHIDDFRSLHLVEVLSAVRRFGQQIICAVEDEGLAELMCRRIRQGEFGEGRLIKMEYRVGEGANMESSFLITPPARQLLLPV
jgi:chromosome segregation protein